MPQPIIVVGSSNTDMVIKAEKFPMPGETLLGGEFFLFPGGKGANQAVAAARLGGNVIFIAKVGNDIFGEQALQQFKREGIITDYVAKDPHLPSGVALITVDSKGENTIVVAQGSNGALSPEEVNKAEREFEKAEIVLTQLETPLLTILHVAKLARKTGKKLILNPAPAMSLPDDLFPYLFLITPNETETETLTGIKIKDHASMKLAAEKLKDKGVANVIITLGSEGVYLHDTAGGRHIPTRKVKVVDSTAAGDVFNGALTVALSENRTLEQAAEFANHAAAISVTKMGAQASAPYRKELTNNGK
ncbi:MAG TPA: ribokinase [Chryseolinea sp.]